MNIAISSTGETLDSPVFANFAQTPFLLIANMETLECTTLPHVPGSGSDLELARKILEYDCEAVITGKLGEAAFTLLADNHVTRYTCAELSGRAALQAMERRELALIRNADGSEECHGNHPALEDLRTCREH